MFADRAEAGRKLAERLRDLPLVEPIVLGIPRGGVVVASALARELKAELDVVLARKIPAPGNPEVAAGAIAETGEIIRNEELLQSLAVPDEYFEAEAAEQRSQLARRRRRYRAVQPAVPLAGRSVIVADDGLATGSTMIAALQTVRRQKPREIVLAVPVASPDRLTVAAALADRAVCLLEPPDFSAVGCHYRHFDAVTDSEVLQCLKSLSSEEGV